mmetsp:Transcript_27484/g.88331  ORF Transcript_27484/g.88331 Transcript_27484/m.88331 type:complete len:231 (-) Transcript_27484:409-1101(-)
MELWWLCTTRATKAGSGTRSSGGGQTSHASCTTVAAYPATTTSSIVVPSLPWANACGLVNKSPSAATRAFPCCPTSTSTWSPAVQRQRRCSSCDRRRRWTGCRPSRRWRPPTSLSPLQTPQKTRKDLAPTRTCFPVRRLRSARCWQRRAPLPPCRSPWLGPSWMPPGLSRDRPRSTRRVCAFEAGASTRIRPSTWRWRGLRPALWATMAPTGIAWSACGAATGWRPFPAS